MIRFSKSFHYMILPYGDPVILFTDASRHLLASMTITLVRWKLSCNWFNCKRISNETLFRILYLYLLERYKCNTNGCLPGFSYVYSRSNCIRLSEEGKLAYKQLLKKSTAILLRTTRKFLFSKFLPLSLYFSVRSYIFIFLYHLYIFSKFQNS